MSRAPAPNPFDLTGRVAIVTGGNGGLGLGMALGLARAGARVAVVGRDEGKLATAAKAIEEEAGAEAAAIVADVSRAEDIDRIVSEARGRFGRIDIVINNAGTTIRKAPQDLDPEDWRRVVDVNLTGAFLLSRAAYPALKEAGGGKVVNIGSMASIFGLGYGAAYAASKGGLVQLTKSLALAWAADNIQVNAILPGWFDTAMTRDARREVAGLNERVLARVPLGRWGEPADIAGTAVWLASRASDFVTGIAVPVDGGYSAMP